MRNSIPAGLKRRLVRNRLIGSSDRYLFNSSFDERKTIGYLLNLIDSSLFHDRYMQLFRFSADVLGESKVLKIINKKYPEIFKSNGNNGITKVKIDNIDEVIPLRTLTKVIREDIASELLSRFNRLSSHKDFRIKKRLNLIQKTFDLTDEEIEILIFYYLLENCRLVESYFGGADFLQLRQIAALKNYGRLILGINNSSLVKVFSKGVLFHSNLLGRAHRMSGEGIGISQWCRDYLLGMGEKDITQEFFEIDEGKTLDIADFEIKEDELLVIKTLLDSKYPQNILFYGAPGAGKTSFTKSMTKEAGKRLYKVKIPESDNIKDRRSAIYATLNLADRNNSIILIDEADEILNSHKSQFFESKIDKSWINNLLESHKQKIIWITNRSSEIDLSTMRRFSFSLAFRQFNSKSRFKVLKRELGVNRLGSYFTEDELEELCRNYNVNADGIIKAINVLKISRSTPKNMALRKIRVVLNSHEKTTAGGNLSNKMARNTKDYSLEGLNTSYDLNKLVATLKEYIECQERGTLRNNQAISALLYGMPGAGKSEFIYYVGNLLCKDVSLKRCSEIQSMYVGQTEKNISSAFYEAQTNGNILFFDEADSFLFPRKDAVRSWEKNFTNEILTQLESYTGIVFFATNDIDGLDNAALRRFKFKVEFLPLTPEGSVNFYRRLLNPLVSDNHILSKDEIDEIKNVKNLTPGDFIVVRDQYNFMGDSSLTHGKLIESLSNEVGHKKMLNKTRIGF